jgi:hypothetical protein
LSLAVGRQDYCEDGLGWVAILINSTTPMVGIYGANHKNNNDLDLHAQNNFFEISCRSRTKSEYVKEDKEFRDDAVRGLRL